MRVSLQKPRVTLSGKAAPARAYVAVRTGTAVLSSSERLTMRAPGDQPEVVELREDHSGTIQKPMYGTDDEASSTSGR